MSEPEEGDGDRSGGPTAGIPDPFAGPSWSGDRAFPGHRAGAIRVRRKRRVWWRVGRKRRSGSTDRSPLRRLIVAGAGALGLLMLLSLAWLVFSGLKARSDLESVRGGVAKMRLQITAGDLDGARATARLIKGDADAASLFTSGPVWALGSAVPYLGDPMDTARSLTSSVKLVADEALPPLIDASSALRPSKLREANGTFDLKPIEALGPTMLNAATTMKSALAGAKGADGSTWLGPVNHARSQLIDQLTPLTSTVVNIGRAARVLPPVLGVDGSKRYMISFENDAEIRATGGIPGAFAIVTINRGRVHFTHFEPDSYLFKESTPPSILGQEFQSLYPAAPLFYLDSNYSPHFPYAAQIWAAMWKQKTGEQLDGAMVVDSTALSYLLRVTGPVTLANGGQVSAGNIVQLTQQTLYDRYPGFTGPSYAGRKRYLEEIAQSVTEKLFAPGVDTTALVNQGGKGAEQGRLLFWAKNPTVEDEVARLPLGGTLPKTKHPYVAVALNNNANSKLDYYLHASLDWQRTGCGSNRDVTVTLKLFNSAPPDLPPYVEGSFRPEGTSQFDIAIYGSIGGRFTTSSGDYILDNPQIKSTTEGTDQGHPVYEAHLVNLAPGSAKTFVFHEIEPPGQGRVIVRPQPMVNPMTVTTKDSSC